MSDVNCGQIPAPSVLHPLIQRLDATDAVRYHHNARIKRKQPLGLHLVGVFLIIDFYFDGTDAEKAVLKDAAIKHDLAEGIVGDLSYTFKLLYPAVAKAHKAAELAELKKMGIVLKLTKSQVKWLKLADMLEAIRYMVQENGKDELDRADVGMQFAMILRYAEDVKKGFSTDIIDFVRLLAAHYG